MMSFPLWEVELRLVDVRQHVLRHRHSPVQVVEQRQAQIHGVVPPASQYDAHCLAGHVTAC